jgi:hypothetical protein
MKVIELTINGNQDQDKIIDFADTLGAKTIYKRFESVGYRVFMEISENTDDRKMISDILSFASKNGIFAELVWKPFHELKKV